MADFQMLESTCFNMVLVLELKNKYNLAINCIKKSIFYHAKKMIVRGCLSLKNRRKEENIVKIN